MPGETEYATVNTLFLEGMAHTSIVGPWFVPSIKDKGIDVGFAPMPVVDETGEAISPYCGVQGVHVIKVHAEEKKEAITYQSRKHNSDGKIIKLYSFFIHEE